jgi:hypothetical protein
MTPPVGDDKGGGAIASNRLSSDTREGPVYVVIVRTRTEEDALLHYGLRVGGGILGVKMA